MASLYQVPFEGKSALRPLLLAFVSAVLVASPVAAQTPNHPGATASTKATKVVTRSGRPVTARSSTGGTQSFDCNKPENKKRAVCKR